MRTSTYEIDQNCKPSLERIESSPELHPKLAATKEPPLSPDKLLLRENISPSELVPKEIAQRLSTESVVVSSPHVPLDPERHISRVAGEKSAWRIELPENAIIGLPGLSAQRFATGSLAKHFVGTARTEAFRPPWTSHIFHPKFTVAPRLPRMRNRSGRQVIPHSGTYGNDDRKVYYPAGYPLQCVGRVFSYGDNRLLETGTGVLVGPRHVLTAGHMVPWAPSNWAMKFVPGYFDGSSTAGRGVSSWVSDAQGWNNPVSAYDMAVLRLREPLGNWLGWFGSKVYDDDWEDQPYWAMVGYPGDVARGERPSYEIGISVLDDDSDGDALELEHHGDSTPGDSGGPFFSLWPDGFPYVIGTESGGETISGGFLGIGNEDNNVAAGGKAMVDLISWALNTWT